MEEKKINNLERLFLEIKNLLIFADYITVW